MRALFLPLLFALVAPALGFDDAALGARLNGWTRDGSAHYSLDGQQYRTTRPVVTPLADGGGESVVVTVLHRANSWAEVPFVLEVVIAADGGAQSIRITGNPRGQRVDSGTISRPDAPVAAAPAAGAEGQAAAPAVVAAPAFDGTAEMKKQVFEVIDAQLATAAEAKDRRKRDLLARIYGPEPVDAAAISRGLRYNLDLILGLQAAGK